MAMECGGNVHELETPCVESVQVIHSAQVTTWGASSVKNVNQMRYFFKNVLLDKTPFV